ncbi:MAG: DUF4416 family protein [Thermodesulfobacteriota bacterium]
MSRPASPRPAKLVISLFLQEKNLIQPVVEDLRSCFGELDLVSAWLPFDFTSYYAPEMGEPLFRRVMSFEGLIRQSTLASIKRQTNAIEKAYARAGRRRVNIDPGYLLAERFVLATGKNFTHRIYIGGGIYADLTLVFQKGAFQTLPWTYPDYAEQRMQLFLTSVRNLYLYAMKNVSGGDSRRGR